MVASVCTIGNKKLKTLLRKTTEDTLEDIKAQSSLSNEQLIDQINTMKQKYETKVHHLTEECKELRYREKKLKEILNV